MSRDIVRDNITNYQGEQARKDWSSDGGLFEAERTVIARHFPSAPARVLDLGCGAGRTTLGLEQLGYHVEAIDLSEDLVDEARRRVSRSNVHYMDARELAFDAASFDVALFSFNGLDCVYPSAERERVLDEVWRVLKPGGTFYYSGHNGLAAWGPRPGDNLSKLLARNFRLLAAQRTTFAERTRYMAYPEPSGTQVLYSGLPMAHLHALRAHRFEPLRVYGSRSYRRGPHLLEENSLDGARFALAKYLAHVSATCPHVHYVAIKPTS